MSHKKSIFFSISLIISANIRISINYKDFITQNVHPATVSNRHCGYVYSMVGVYNDSDDSDILSEDMLKMGDTAIVIHAPDEFIKRCSAALESHHKKLEWGRVHYYDKSEGSFFLNPWLKPKEFEYQREFRLYFAMKETKAKVLQIGSIEDIACAYHISLRGA